ncbi:GDSL-type esterase/lipase family protein [Streptococcus acidominimus]|uniref:Esterase n=1 Tax=Streptococcus acidominimus TaxID=1326 RepID=A0A4Y9FPD5_STRAI|nr:GDSL-type esterase/lipase family protein [Streptococcus acidominimus]MBF0819265.1 esterase [Streptococcus acidominimus]MBF0838441.1 esterase [Streptococcus acidominimus]MBF0846420.1 esterase [Streptococcus danieliae]TFU30118.1 esterase [Streptococcus acidominimus]
MPNVMYPEVMTIGNGAIKVATVGDSLTYGYGLENRERDAYPSILAEKLGHHYQVSNFGLSGRSLQSTSDYPYLQEKNAQLSLESEADIVIIMIGSNDSRAPYWNKERFITEYGELVDRYLQMPSQPDVYLLVPPYVPTSRFGLNNAIVRSELQEIIPRIAEEKGLEWINLYPLTEGQAAYYSDGLHLTPLGNQLVAETVYAAIMGESLR